MTRPRHQELWLPSGHFFVEYDYWPPDAGDRSHNPPMGGEVSVTGLTDLATGARVVEGENPELFERCAREIEELLSASFEEKYL